MARGVLRCAWCHCCSTSQPAHRCHCLSTTSHTCPRCTSSHTCPRCTSPHTCPCCTHPAAGNKALAKELSAKGKAAAHKMWESHERASSSIFAQRNPLLQLGKPGAAVSAGASSIDLHGLHVREVQAVLPKQLRALTSQKQRSVSIIVGAGNHTKGAPGPTVGPAVEALLQEMGYAYSMPHAGLIRLHL
jgi:hypothetical protein